MYPKFKTTVLVAAIALAFSVHAAGSTGLCSGSAVCTAPIYQTSGSVTESKDVDITSVYAFSETNPNNQNYGYGYQYGIYSQSQLTLTGQTIHVAPTPVDGQWTLYAVSAMQGGVINLGVDTSEVDLTISDRALQAKTYGLYSGTGSSLIVKGNNVNVALGADEDWRFDGAWGVFAAAGNIDLQANTTNIEIQGHFNDATANTYESFGLGAIKGTLTSRGDLSVTLAGQKRPRVTDSWLVAGVYASQNGQVDHQGNLTVNLTGAQDETNFNLREFSGIRAKGATINVTGDVDITAPVGVYVKGGGEVSLQGNVTIQAGRHGLYTTEEGSSIVLRGDQLSIVVDSDSPDATSGFARGVMADGGSIDIQTQETSIKVLTHAVDENDSEFNAFGVGAVGGQLSHKGDLSIELLGQKNTIRNDDWLLLGVHSAQSSSIDLEGDLNVRIAPDHSETNFNTYGIVGLRANDNSSISLVGNMVTHVPTGVVAKNNSWVTVAGDVDIKGAYRGLAALDSGTISANGSELYVQLAAISDQKEAFGVIAENNSQVRLENNLISIGGFVRGPEVNMAGIVALDSSRIEVGTDETKAVAVQIGFGDATSDSRVDGIRAYTDSSITLRGESVAVVLETPGSNINGAAGIFASGGDVDLYNKNTTIFITDSSGQYPGSIYELYGISAIKGVVSSNSDTTISISDLKEPVSKDSWVIAGVSASQGGLVDLNGYLHVDINANPDQPDISALEISGIRAKDAQVNVTGEVILRTPIGVLVKQDGAVELNGNVNIEASRRALYATEGGTIRAKGKWLEVLMGSEGQLVSKPVQAIYANSATVNIDSAKTNILVLAAADEALQQSYTSFGLGAVAGAVSVTGDVDIQMLGQNKGSDNSMLLGVHASQAATVEIQGNVSTTLTASADSSSFNTYGIVGLRANESSTILINGDVYTKAPTGLVSKIKSQVTVHGNVVNEGGWRGLFVDDADMTVDGDKLAVSLSSASKVESANFAADTAYGVLAVNGANLTVESRSIAVAALEGSPETDVTAIAADLASTVKVGGLSTESIDINLTKKSTESWVEAARALDGSTLTISTDALNIQLGSTGSTYDGAVGILAKGSDQVRSTVTLDAKQTSIVIRGSMGSDAQTQFNSYGLSAVSGDINVNGDVTVQMLEQKIPAESSQWRIAGLAANNQATINVKGNVNVAIAGHPDQKDFSGAAAGIIAGVNSTQGATVDIQGNVSATITAAEQATGFGTNGIVGLRANDNASLTVTGDVYANAPTGLVSKNLSQLTVKGSVVTEGGWRGLWAVDQATMTINEAEQVAVSLSTSSEVAAEKFDAQTAYGIAAINASSLTVQGRQIGISALEGDAAGDVIGITADAGSVVKVGATDLVDITLTKKSTESWVEGVSAFEDGKVTITGQQLNIRLGAENSTFDGAIGIAAEGKYDNPVVTVDAKQTNIVLQGSFGSDEQTKYEAYGVSALNGQVSFNGGLTLQMLGQQAPNQSFDWQVAGLYAAEAGAITVNGDLTVDIPAAKGLNIAAIRIDGNDSKINAVGDVKLNAPIGIYASNDAEVNLKGTVEINADKVIEVFDTSRVFISDNEGKTVTLNGNVVYSQVQQPVMARFALRAAPVSTVELNLAGKDSSWTGSPVGNTDKPSQLSVSLSDGAQWTPTADSSVDALNMTDGVVNLNEASVAVTSLSGSGGTLNIAAKVDGQSVTAPTFSSSEATEPTSFNVNFSGITSDEVKDNEEVTQGLVSLVQVQGATQVQKIPEGLVAGEITQTVGENGEIEEVYEAPNSMLFSLDGIESLNALAFRSTINDVSARMGDLRSTPKSAGGWVRYYGGKMKYGSQNLKNRYNTIQLGADGWINNFYLGGTFSYTDDNSSLRNGSSDGKTYSFGLYGGWLADNGQFIDVTIKRHRMKTDFSLYNTQGLSNSASYHNWGTSVSLEYGWRLNCPANGFYVEPQAEVMYGRIDKASYTTSQGVSVKQKKIDMTIGRVGVQTGYTFPEQKGSVYAKASVLHDWSSKSELTAQKGANKSTYKNDLSGTYGEFAVGGHVNPMKNLQAYGEVKTSTGSPITNPWQVNVGVRYSF